MKIISYFISLLGYLAFIASVWSAPEAPIPALTSPSPVILAPFQNIPLLSTNIPTNVVNTNPALARGNIILGKWKTLIEQNQNESNNITQTTDEIKNDRIIIEGLLRAHKDIPEPTRQEYLLLLDLFKLAQIRNFNKGLKEVESYYVDSIETMEKEGSFDIKRVKSVNSRDSSNEKIVYGIRWYKRQLKKLEKLLSYFNQEVLPKISNPPPPLLTGIHETLKESADTLAQYKQFYGCMDDPSTDRCRAFITVMRTQNPNKSSRPSSSSRYDLDDEEEDLGA